MPTMPHQQLTDHRCWNGTVLIHRGLSFTQYCILYLFTFPVFAKLASSEKSTWLKNETSVRIFLWIFIAYPDNEPHSNLGRFCDVYGIPPVLSTYQNILEIRSFSGSDVLTLEGNAWLTDMSTENAYFLTMSTIPYWCVIMNIVSNEKKWKWFFDYFHTLRD